MYQIFYEQDFMYINSIIKLYLNNAFNAVAILLQRWKKTFTFLSPANVTFVFPKNHQWKKCQEWTQETCNNGGLGNKYTGPYIYQVGANKTTVLGTNNGKKHGMHPNMESHSTI